jgi:hypothetical protein
MRLFAAMPLPREPAAIQKRLLVRRRDPAKHGVAVREAAEAADDIGVKLGVFDSAPVSDGPTQPARSWSASDACRGDRRTAAQPCWPARQKPRSVARPAAARASGSAANAAAAPRNMLRGNWSSTMTSVSAPAASSSSGAIRPPCRRPGIWRQSQRPRRCLSRTIAPGPVRANRRAHRRPATVRDRGVLTI